jgi:hypothetical protein
LKKFYSEYQDETTTGAVHYGQYLFQYINLTNKAIMETIEIILLVWILCAFLFWRLKGWSELVCLWHCGWWIPILLTILSPLLFLFWIGAWVLGIKQSED